MYKSEIDSTMTLHQTVPNFNNYYLLVNLVLTMPTLTLPSPTDTTTHP